DVLRRSPAALRRAGRCLGLARAAPVFQRLRPDRGLGKILRAVQRLPQFRGGARRPRVLEIRVLQVFQGSSVSSARPDVSRSLACLPRSAGDRTPGSGSGALERAILSAQRAWQSTLRRRPADRFLSLSSIWPVSGRRPRAGLLPVAGPRAGVVLRAVRARAGRE